MPAWETRPTVRAATERCTEAAISAGSAPSASRGDDLGLGEGRAHAGDLEILGSSQGQVVQVAEFDAQGAGEHVEETPRPARAAIVHREVVHKPDGVDGDRLAVLAADIHDERDAGAHRRDSACVAGDFGERAIDARDKPAAVAGGDHLVQGISGQSGIGKDAVDGDLDRLPADRAHLDHTMSEHDSRLVDDDRLGRRRAEVDPHGA